MSKLVENRRRHLLLKCWLLAIACQSGPFLNADNPGTNWSGSPDSSWPISESDGGHQASDEGNRHYNVENKLIYSDFSTQDEQPPSKEDIKTAEVEVSTTGNPFRKIFLQASKYFEERNEATSTVAEAPLYPTDEGDIPLLPDAKPLEDGHIKNDDNEKHHDANKDDHSHAHAPQHEFIVSDFTQNDEIPEEIAQIETPINKHDSKPSATPQHELITSDFSQQKDITSIKEEAPVQAEIQHHEDTAPVQEQAPVQESQPHTTTPQHEFITTDFSQQEDIIAEEETPLEAEAESHIELDETLPEKDSPKNHPIEESTEIHPATPKAQQNNDDIYDIWKNSDKEPSGKPNATQSEHENESKMNSNEPAQVQVPLAEIDSLSEPEEFTSTVSEEHIHHFTDTPLVESTTIIPATITTDFSQQVEEKPLDLSQSTKEDVHEDYSSKEHEDKLQNFFVDETESKMDSNEPAQVQVPLTEIDSPSEPEEFTSTVSEAHAHRFIETTLAEPTTIIPATITTDFSQQVEEKPLDLSQSTKDTQEDSSPKVLFFTNNRDDRLKNFFVDEPQPELATDDFLLTADAYEAPKLEVPVLPTEENKQAPTTIHPDQPVEGIATPENTESQKSEALPEPEKATAEPLKEEHSNQEHSSASPCLTLPIPYFEPAKVTSQADPIELEPFTTISEFEAKSLPLAENSEKTISPPQTSPSTHESNFKERKWLWNSAESTAESIPKPSRQRTVQSIQASSPEKVVEAKPVYNQEIKEPEIVTPKALSSEIIAEQHQPATPPTSKEIDTPPSHAHTSNLFEGQTPTQTEPVQKQSDESEKELPHHSSIADPAEDKTSISPSTVTQEVAEVSENNEAKPSASHHMTLVTPTSTETLDKEHLDVVAQAITTPHNETATTTTAAEPPKEVSINFNNVAMIEYIRFISRISNKNFIFDDQDLQFNVTIVSEEPTTVDNLMAALLQELRIRNLSLMEQGNNIIIHTNPRVRAPARIEAEGLVPTHSKDNELVTRVFRLNTLDPLKTSEIIRPLLSDEALVEVLRDTNNMIITDFTVNVNKIAQLIQSLDAPHSGVTVGQYVVHNGFVDPLVSLANQILSPIAQGNPYVLVPHSATNSIFVVANEFIVEKALAILENLDFNEGRTRILSLDKLQLRDQSEIDKEAAAAKAAAAARGVGGAGTGLNREGIGAGGAGGIGGAGLGTGGLGGGANEIYPGGHRYNIPGTPGYDPNLPASYPFGTPGGINVPGTPTYNPNEPINLGPGGIGTEGRPGIFEGKEFVPGGISTNPRWVQGLPTGHIERTLFFIYKLKYRKGDQIETALNKIGQSLLLAGTANSDIVAAINSSQWIEASNSLIFTGTYQALERIKELITEVDLPLRQVFIEMLILDTTIIDSLTYGVDWGTRFGGGNTVGGQSFLGLGSVIDSALNGGTTAAAINTVPSGPTTAGLLSATGYSAGVIGRHLTHGGLQFNTIGALVEALYTDTNTNIIMNPKIVTEDNNPAEIFVGSTQRYKTQSISNDIGSTITNNFQFIDVGSTFRVTPQIGNNGIITLDIVQENTSDNGAANATSNNPSSVDVNLVPVLNKSRTTTRIHVPDGFFVIISGMISDTETDTLSRIPCIGGIPLIGGISKQQGKSDSKRNIMLFIRPLIVDSEEELENITKRQQDVIREKNKHKRTWNYEIDEALDFLNIKSTDVNDYCPRI